MTKPPKEKFVKASKINVQSDLASNTPYIFNVNRVFFAFLANYAYYT